MPLRFLHPFISSIVVIQHTEKHSYLSFKLSETQNKSYKISRWTFSQPFSPAHLFTQSEVKPTVQRMANNQLSGTCCKPWFLQQVVVPVVETPENVSFGLCSCSSIDGFGMSYCTIYIQKHLKLSKSLSRNHDLLMKELFSFC